MHVTYLSTRSLTNFFSAFNSLASTPADRPDQTRPDQIRSDQIRSNQIQDNTSDAFNASMNEWPKLHACLFVCLFVCLIHLVGRLVSGVLWAYCPSAHRSCVWSRWEPAWSTTDQAIVSPLSQLIWDFRSKSKSKSKSKSRWMNASVLFDQLIADQLTASWNST